MTQQEDSIYRDIYKNYLPIGFWLSIFLNCTCINSIVLFPTGKWMLNLGNGYNVHDPDFVFKI